ncbi:MAG: ASPIC/UnbV domain-containing protein [Planctomycetes bacterium]|nr:ASPIC/UnbV domain-containing protein [Planctomycetota bacterium]
MAGTCFFRVRLQGKGENCDALGAVLRATIGDRTEERVVRSGSSYLSQSGLDATSGLGKAEKINRLEVRSPSGMETTLEGVPAPGSVLPEREP